MEGHSAEGILLPTSSQPTVADDLTTGHHRQEEDGQPPLVSADDMERIVQQHFEGLSDVGRQVPRTQVNYSDVAAARSYARGEGISAEVARLCAPLLGLSGRSLVPASNATNGGEDAFCKLLCDVALVQKPNPATLSDTLLECLVARMDNEDQRGHNNGSSDTKVNRSFHRSDIEGYNELLVDVRHEQAVSVHAKGGETHTERWLSAKAPFEDERSYAVYREELTTEEGKYLAVLQRLHAKSYPQRLAS